jgi:hypothetical protein
MTTELDANRQSLYEADYLKWIETTIEKLRVRDYSNIDWENLIMAYSDFTTLTKVREAFGLTLAESIDLFTDIPEVLPSAYLHTTLNENVFLATAITTEKARSELIIAPVLLEVRRILNFQIGFFSGSEFNVDLQAGLSGYCDYILTASKESYEIRTPDILTSFRVLVEFSEAILNILLTLRFRVQYSHEFALS